MRILSRAIFLVLLLTLVVGIVAAQDTAAVEWAILQNDEVEEGRFTEDVTARFYAFWGSEGDAVTIDMRGAEGSKVDSYLMLMAPNGDLIAVDDDGGQVFPDAQISDAELPEDGIYLVLASMPEFIFSGNAVEDVDSLDYEIHLTGSHVPDMDVDDFTVFAAEDMGIEAFGLGSSGVFDMEEQHIAAMVVFEGTEGETVTISTTAADGEVDTVLFLFGPEGEIVAFNDDESSDSRYSMLADVELPEDGQYLVMAVPYGFYDALENDWTVSGAFGINVE